MVERMREEKSVDGKRDVNNVRVMKENAAEAEVWW